ncbi:MAG: ABC transporter permease [Anaerolineaceae bacterium]|nr:ABC transporter permease [Anaerolineaceae bacterium]MCY3935660.1 ABC transporter permease [Chloroflexota bacterium]MCY4009603.1 ABC transporter permease [Anaerolineaceae bacterium]MCY4105590.1 ABC transporter permease [Chloroflexota bacterium]
MAEKTHSIIDPEAVPQEAIHHRWESWRRGIYRFRTNRMSMVGLVILIFILLVAISAPWIAPYPEAATRANPLARDQSPNETYYFGTDRIGRDIFSRVLLGTGLALRVGTTIVFMASSIGVTIGAVSGYFGGWVEELLMRFTDIFLTVPGLVLAIAFTAALGRGIDNAMIGIALVWWPGFARMTRSQVISIKEEPYVEAIYGLGGGHMRIIFRHILPNAFSPIIIKMTTDFGFAVLTAAALGFVGVGAQPPTPEWGAMINFGRDYFPERWWMSTFPGMAIWLMVFCWNLLGDGLRDVLDPRSRR